MNHKNAEYNPEASSYDESRFHSKLGQHLDYMHKKIVDVLMPSPAGLVLEMGAGTGRITTWLAEKGFEVIGVDVSREMLKKAKKNANVKHSEIGLVLADMRFLPFRRATFDSCVCVNVVDHTPDVNNALKEVSKVIKPKGVFIFNYSNIQSLYLPIAFLVNLRKKALFKRNIYTRWLTLKEISILLMRNHFHIKEARGCMLASYLPFGERLINIVQRINFLAENSIIKFYSGSVFIKTQLEFSH